jgi:Flp pilus assembly protein CpaB
LKRSSNRLVLLVGVFLAVVAFVLIAVMFSGGGGDAGRAQASPTTVAVVVAAKDIPLGSKIAQDAVTTKPIDAASKPGDAYTDTSLVIGQTARQPITSGQLITSEILNGGGSVANLSVPAGYSAIAVQVDQVTGVGTLIKPGDNVDVVMAITGADKVPLVVFQGGTGTPVRPQASGSPAPSGSTQYQGAGLPYNSTTVKTIVEGAQVIGTLLPPPAQTGSPAPSSGSTSLNGQQEIVIIAVTAQQAEAIKFSQMDGTISLVLRSSADCQSATTGQATPCPIIPTSGITLRKMVDEFGVLPPQIVEVLMPTPYPSPMPSRLFPSPSPSPSGAVPSGSTAP